MKRIGLIFPGLFLFLHSQSQTVSNIAANYHDGQIFITWTNVANCDTGFYYVYKDSVPITNLNIQQSTYLGRVPFNFSYDYRFSVSVADGNSRFLVTDDSPFTVLDTTQNLFVLNCTQDSAQDYFALRCNFHDIIPNWHTVADSNATSVVVTEHLDPIKAYLQEAGINFPGAKNGETLDAYIHFGSNIAVGSYPAMVDEGCLPFHFGIIKAGAIGGNNACFIKFHGGSGNFVNNTLTAHIDNTWKISFDDWIPAFEFDPSGFNTRWFGYNEHFNIYEDDNNSPSPTSGVIHAYTYYRIKWELAWIKNRWPNTLDSTRQYLIGASQGNAAVLIHSILDPSLYSAGNLNDPKFNVAAGDDTNPDCKYNNNTGSARKASRVLWGNEDVTNLLTDVPVVAGSNQYFRIYDLTNMNFMLHYRRNTSLPFLKAINGKNDINTCWDEKISFYDSIQTTHAGGVYCWDLREHGGGANNEWPPFDIPTMLRYNSYKSYPAFSFTSLDGNPGSDNEHNPPYYNGDDVGALHASLDWVDSSVVDSSYLWQIQLFSYRNLLNDGTYIPTVLPEVVTTDVTIRRAQHFRNFPADTKLCWLNFYHGELIQSGSVTQKYDDTDAMPITIPKVKIFQDGNILRVVLCDSLQPTGMLPEYFYEDNLNKSLIVSNESLAFTNRNEFKNDFVEFKNFLGEDIGLYQNKSAPYETFSSQSNLLQAGIYFLRLKNSESSAVFKLVKI